MSHQPLESKDLKMLFLILFVLGVMALPLTIDLMKNGRNNILVKSYREFVTLPGVSALVRWINLLKK